MAKEPASSASGRDEFIARFRALISRFAGLIPSATSDPVTHAHLSVAAHQVERRALLLLDIAQPSPEAIGPVLPALQQQLGKMGRHLDDVELCLSVGRRGGSDFRDLQFGGDIRSFDQAQILRSIGLIYADPLSLTLRDRVEQLNLFPYLAGDLKDYFQKLKDTCSLVVALIVLLAAPEDAVILEEQWDEWLEWLQWVDQLIDWLKDNETDGGTEDPPPQPGKDPGGELPGGDGPGQAPTPGGGYKHPPSQADCGPASVSAGPIWGGWFHDERQAIKDALNEVRNICRIECSGNCADGCSCNYFQESSEVVEVEKRVKITPGGPGTELGADYETVEWRAKAISRGVCRCETPAGAPPDEGSVEVMRKCGSPEFTIEMPGTGTTAQAAESDAETKASQKARSQCPRDCPAQTVSWRITKPAQKNKRGVYECQGRGKYACRR